MLDFAWPRRRPFVGLLWNVVLHAFNMADDAINRTNEDFRQLLLQPSRGAAPATAALPPAAAALPMDVEATDAIPVEAEVDPESDWSELRLQRGQLQMQPMLLTGLLRQSGAAIRVLNLSGCREYVNDGVMRSVAAHCPEIQVLDVSECDVTDAGIAAIVSGCAVLDGLHVSNCAGITDEAIKAISHRGTRLSTFECAGCTRVTDAGKALLELGVIGTGE